MQQRHRSITGGLALWLAVLVTSCTSPSSGVTLQSVPWSFVSTAVSSPPAPISLSSPGAPTSSRQQSVAQTSSPPTLSSATSSSTPSSPVDTEAADRQAIQALWDRYWTTGANAIKATPTQQKKLMSDVAVDPALALVLQGYAKFAKNGWTDYGTVTHRPYWSVPVAGKSTAVMGDCMDDSKAGSMDIKTGKKLTVGVARDNVRVTVARDGGGTWRVQQIQYLVTVPC